MPIVTLNGARLHYEDRGRGPETIVFAHGLLWSSAMFEPQIRALEGRHRCIGLDLRGQGASEVTRGGYDMETLAEDAVALIAHLGCAPCHFVGLSMGGFIGMRVAARRPELVRSLVLLETSADPEPLLNRPKYALLSLVARLLGFGVVTRKVMAIMFGRKFLDDPARAALRAEWVARLHRNDRVGVSRAVRGVIHRRGVIDEIARIAAPTLVVVGDQDVATPLERARRIHARVAGSRLVVIPGAGHTSTIEEPETVTAAIAAHVEMHSVKPPEETEN